MWRGKFATWVALFGIFRADAVYAMFGYIDSDIYGTAITFDGNVAISENSTVAVGDIDIAGSLFINNRGMINADFNICDGCRLYIQNSGDISGRFNPGENAGVTQVIRGNADVTDIGLTDGFDILVYGAERVSLYGVMNIGAHADKIVLNDSSLVMDGNVLRLNGSGSPDIELSGDIVIYLNSIRDIGHDPILRNVSGDGAVYFRTPDSDALFAITSYIADGNVFARIVRETDYVKILGADPGAFINSLRGTTDDDGLLAALDRAETMSELRGVMSRSVRLNPINLMRPIRAFQSYEILTPHAVPELREISIMPSVAVGKDFYLYAAKLSASLRIVDGMVIGVSAYVGQGDVSDDINEFSASMFGAGIRADYNGGGMVARTVAGISFASFDSGPVYSDGDTIINPDGISFYAASDLGMRFDFDSGIYAVPFAGIITDVSHVANDGDFNFGARIGTDVGFASGGGDIRYDYTIRFTASSVGAVGVAVRMSFWSPWDGAGGDVELTAINDEYGISGQIAIHAKFEF